MMNMPRKLAWLMFLILPILTGPAHAAKLSVKSMILITGGTPATIRVSSIKGTPILGNTNPEVVSAELSSNTITVAPNAVGTSTLSVTDSSSRPAVVKVTVQPPMSLSTDFVEVEVKKSAKVTVNNVAGKLRVTNSSSKKVKAAFRSGTLTITGASEGEATLTISDGKTTQTLSVSVKSKNNSNVATVSGNTQGRLLASNCFQCHGTYGSGGFETLRGKTDLASELNEYLNGGEDPNGIMSAHLKGYTPEQLQLIVDYLANP